MIEILYFIKSVIFWFMGNSDLKNRIAALTIKTELKN